MNENIAYVVIGKPMLSIAELFHVSIIFNAYLQDIMPNLYVK